MAKFKIFYIASQVINQDKAPVNSFLDFEIESDYQPSRQEASIMCINECARIVAETAVPTTFVALQTVIKIPVFVSVKSNVYPNKDNSVEVLNDDGYNGAHLYRVQNSTGMNSQTNQNEYLNNYTEIQFVQKHEDGSVTPGVQLSQMLWVLLDSVTKMNEKYPCDENKSIIEHLQGAIKANVDRTKKRIERKVAGKLEQ